MKSIVISIRVTPWKLAKMLDGINQVDKTFEPRRLSRIVQRSIDIGLSYTSYNLPIEPSSESLSTINRLTTQTGRTSQTDIKDPMTLIDSYQPRQKITLEEALKQGEEIAKAQWSERSNGASAPPARSNEPTNHGRNPLTNDVELGSEKNNVTDFRPPDPSEQ